MTNSKDIKKRSVTISGHPTSISIETEFWDILKSIATRQEISINDLLSRIDDGREGNLSSATRIYILKDLISENQTHPKHS
ncbi:MAG: aryl-sulfate sulfotransferase [Rhodospirillaceae bacterium]|jgi:predicted DNA-binding ribbon-helix-helix protein|nr:aryl-sulfate sulfotransferase [Rhodospirillaceae bacterium]MDG1274377.1 ribbon-helix-helix domain-containing protein [Alphaproteobacteria bacterium]MDG1887098.1 ribbon-helix-helix domain-containing protein [Alphaproteobacteria bacterium]|tara:strand:- start:412 stop:654 length:243 start_codon:yes stop_codon:yes gene_type:complete